MNVTPNAEFAKRMMLLARPSENFVPTVTYDPDGDCIEFVAKPGAFYAERVDDLVTVYYGQESDEVIGSLIKGVSKFCSEVQEKMPGFRLEIHDGPCRLVHIFRAKLWTSKHDPRDMVTLTYKKLIEVAEESNAELDGNLCLAE